MASKNQKVHVVDTGGVYMHNGEGRPDLQFPDPITGEMIGGQVGAVRMAMRYPHMVCPWARRQGKSKFRPFLIQNEATITLGTYYAGICYPDHTTAMKIALNFKDSWGDLVEGFKINDKDQDRWIKLKAFTPPCADPPEWFTEEMKARWIHCWENRGDPKEGNTGSQIYFWSTTHPFYEKIQGFPHPFHRVDWDECQQIHPGAYGIVRPMLDDIGGHECFSGTPWHKGIGNVQFEKWWDIAGDPTAAGWCRMRIPVNTNPHVQKKDLKEQLRIGAMTQQEVDQVGYARFLTGEGAVFENIDKVMILEPLINTDESLDWVRDIRRKHGLPTMDWWIHQAEAINGHTYGVSIDWGRAPKGDFSVLTVFDFTTAKQVALFRWRGVPFTIQMEAVLAVQSHYGAKQLHSDSNGVGLAMSDFMRRRHALGFVAHKFGRNKEHYVTQARVLFQDIDIAMIDCAEQRHEFKSFTAHESTGLGGERKISYSAPEGEHDDLVDSFLQLAPTLTIVGRQEVVQPEPEDEPMFTKKGGTTIERFTGGAFTPWDHADEDDGVIDWSDIVV